MKTLVTYNDKKTSFLVKSGHQEPSQFAYLPDNTILFTTQGI